MTTRTEAIVLAKTRRAPSRAVLGSAVLMASLLLGGCESANNLLGTSQPDASVAAPQAAAPQAAPTSIAKVALAPIIGAPDGVAQQIHQEFAAEAQKQRIAVVKSPEDRADYTLRGYLVAAKDRAGTKVSYIFDVTDPSGRRMNRITGDETAQGNGTASRDPWSLVSVSTAQAIAQKSVASLAAWLPQSGGQIPVAAAPSNPAPQGVGAQAAAASPIQTAAVAGGAVQSQPLPPIQAAAPVAQKQQIAAVSGGGDVAAIVPTVVGAPGDGPSSLSSALQRELVRNGIASTSSPAAYRVEGKVTMGAAREGKQPIQIEWNVKDPKGKSLGTVSQKNEIPEGSLNGQWGRIADDAAGAATQGVLKLLPPTRAIN